ncbi:hypothetical protein MBLNU457_7722t2 [Dothideomycetes sp. NU457]
MASSLNQAQNPGEFYFFNEEPCETPGLEPHDRPPAIRYPSFEAGDESTAMTHDGPLITWSEPPSRSMTPRSNKTGRKYRIVEQAVRSPSDSSDEAVTHALTERGQLDPETYRRLTSPAPAKIKPPPHPDWQDLGEDLFTSVTLADGRTAERDRKSGHWRWRDTDATTIAEDDWAYPTPLRKKCSSSAASSATLHSRYRAESPPPPLPQPRRSIGHVSVQNPPIPPKATQPVSQNPPSPPVPTSLFTASNLPHEIVFVILVCLAQFLALGGLSQTVAPQSLIGAAFNVTDLGTISWYTAAFSLTVGTFILPAGRIGDMLGHKRVYLLGWLWYGIWSLITGFSFRSSSVVFTVCRALQGVGPAFLVPNAMALIGISFPMGQKRNIIFALFGAMGPLGFVTGSVLSSVFAQLAWWPWMFWAQSIVCFVIGLLSAWLIPARTKKSTETITGTFDFAGAVTGVAGLVLVNFAFNQAPLSGWNDLHVPVLLVVGLGFFAAFIFVELKIASAPLIPLKGLSKDGGFALACIAAGWGSHGMWLYYFFLFLEKIRGYEPLTAAAMISPVAITGVCFALSTGVLVKKIKVAWIMVVAMLGFLVGILLLSVAPAGQTYWALTFVSVLLTPLGMNLSFPAGTVLLSNSLPATHQGVAASLIATMVNYSISTGLGIAGSIDRYVTQHYTKLNHGEVTQEVMLRGFRGAWYFGMALDVAGLAVALWFVWRSRQRPQPIGSKV